jgi:hypothetical protein
MDDARGSLSWFLQRSEDEVVEILKEFNSPQLGVFVPDGSRRLVLAYTNLQPGDDDFYRASAALPAEFVLRSLRVFFDHRLPILLVPILGRSMLKRGEKYQALTLLEGLQVLFKNQATLDFYRQYQIQVRVYGRPECLQGTTCEPALAWIHQACEQTAEHRKHKLFYAIGESPTVGEEAARHAAMYALEHGRVPTLEEQIQAYYGEVLPPADFFIMTSKMSGMGALPNLLVNGDTEIYYLPTVMGLTETNYRTILYDLLYHRAALRQGIEGFDLQTHNRLALRQAYDRSIERVVGVGFDVGKVWVMADDNSPAKGTGR